MVCLAYTAANCKRKNHQLQVISEGAAVPQMNSLALVQVSAPCNVFVTVQYRKVVNS